MIETLTSDPPIRAGGAATSGSGRVGNLDVLRAVAALAVLAVHAYSLGGRSAPIKAQYLYDVPLRSLASGVWLFFGISGYVISRPFIARLLSGRALPDPGTYAIRRAFRIYPIYLLSLAAFIAISGTPGVRTWQLPFHVLLLHNLIPGQEEALLTVAWTLTVEVLFYIAVPLAAFALNRRRPSAERLALLVLISWITSILFTLAADAYPFGQTGLWLRGLFPSMWQMFCPGILLAIAPHITSPRWRRWIVDAPARPAAMVAAVLLLCAACVLSTDAPLGYGVRTYEFLVDAARPLFALSFGIVLARAIRARPWGERWPWSLRLGLVSYGIYLFHSVIAVFLIQHDLEPVPHDTVLAFVVNTACLAALTIALALLSWRFLEEPAIRFSRVLGDRLRASRARRSPVAGST